MVVVIYNPHNKVLKKFRQGLSKTLKFVFRNYIEIIYINVEYIIPLFFQVYLIFKCAHVFQNGVVVFAGGLLLSYLRTGGSCKNI